MIRLLTAAAASIMLAGVPTAFADSFVEKCVAAAEEAGKPADQATKICVCMEEKAEGNEDLLKRIAALAELPPEERDAAAAKDADVETVRNACRPT